MCYELNYRINKEILCIDLSGPLGDCLCALPAIAEFKEKNKQKIVLTSSKADMAKVLYASGLFDEVKLCPGVRPNQGNHLDLRQRFAIGLGVKLQITEIPELQIAPRPPHGIEKYVVICPEASGLKRNVREIDCGIWTSIVEYIHSQGYQVVQVGKTWYEIPEVDLNLVGKTTLWELAGIVKASTLIISVDTGVFHLAHALRITQIVFFTVTDKKYREYSDTYSIQIDVCDKCRRQHIKPIQCPEGHNYCKQFKLEQITEMMKKILQPISKPRTE
jgi:ADP-heptose:LPS heptosyltransferase